MAPVKNIPKGSCSAAVLKGTNSQVVKPQPTVPTSTLQEKKDGSGKNKRGKDKVVQHINEITWANDLGDAVEKGKENQLTDEISQKNLLEVLKYLDILMKEVPINQIKRKEDVKELINLHRHLTDYLGQGSMVSDTSDVSAYQCDEYDNWRQQTSMGQNRTIISIFNLADLVQLSRTSVNAQLSDRLKSLKKIVGNVFLVKENGYPSPLLLKLWRQILSSITHSHDKGITHGCLTPRGILISRERSFRKGESQKELRLCAKPIFDLAPHEQRKSPSILNRSAESVDIYSLGEIFFYCITGRCPSIDELKTAKNKSDSSLVGCPEADDLISCMLIKNPESSPKAIELLDHPLFWKSEKRLSFLRDTSERVGHDPRYPDDLSLALEGIAVDQIIGKGNGNKFQTWNQMIDEDIIRYAMERNSTYDFCSVRDLVRFIRNMRVHHRKLPRYIKELVGSLHEPFDRYFTKRFPILFIEVYKAVSKCCKNEKYHCRYFGGDLSIAN